MQFTSRDALEALNKLPGVHGSLLVGRDGMMITSNVQMDVNEDAISAVASNVLSALSRALKRMELGEFKRYIVSGKSARIAMYQVGPTVLMLLLDKNANMGLITIELRDTIAQLEKSISL